MVFSTIFSTTIWEKMFGTWIYKHPRSHKSQLGSLVFSLTPGLFVATYEGRCFPGTWGMKRKLFISYPTEKNIQRFPSEKKTWQWKFSWLLRGNYVKNHIKWYIFTALMVESWSYFFLWQWHFPTKPGCHNKPGNWRDDGGFFNNPLVRPFLVPRGVAFRGGWATARQILMIMPGEDMYLSSLKPSITPVKTDKRRWFVVKHMIKVVHPEASCEFLKLIYIM